MPASRPHGSVELGRRGGILLNHRARLVAIVVSTAAAVLQPRPTLTVSEWADNNRILTSATSAEPGQWRTDRVPYLREVMDTIGGTTHRRVVFAKSARVGGSEAGNNAIGFFIDYDPCGILIAYPSDDTKKIWSKEVLDPLIEETEALRNKVAPDGPRREKENTISRKAFPGGFLGILSAGSTKQLRARTARLVVAEEIDDWEADVGEQGDPLSLLETRTDTYGDIGKVYIVSTPTVEGASPIWDQFLDSDQRKFHVPCPSCGALQELIWKDEKETYRLVCEQDDSGHPIPETARYQCAHCEFLIEESEKAGMLAAGVWVAQNPANSTAGFHISQLYSPFASWAEIMRKFIKAKSNPSKLKTFVNTVLGLPFTEKGEKINQRFLEARVESYGPDVEVPHGVAVLTAGIDKQSDRIEVVVWGWGPDLESWLINWTQLHGQTGEKYEKDNLVKASEVYEQLDELLLRDWKHASGNTMRIAAAGFDAGDDAAMVTDYCDKRRGRVPVFSLLGRSGVGLPLIQTPSDLSQKRTAKKWKRHVEGSKHHIVGVDSGKDDLLRRLKKLERGADYVHFPDTTDPVFFDQITSEVKVPRRIGSQIRRVWKKLEGRNNEVLDCTVYARAALQRLGQPFINTLGALAQRLSAKVAPSQPPPTAPAGQSSPPPRRRTHRGVDW